MKQFLFASLFLFIFFTTNGQHGWKILTMDSITLKEKNLQLTKGLEKMMDFSLGGDKINVWGSGVQYPRQYPDEVLPAFFLRTLQFEDPGLEDGAFEWIFTGSNGGVTIKVNGDQIALIQQYYDSFGFNDIDPESEKMNAGRYPQRKVLETTTSYTGQIITLSLESTNNLLLTLKVNGIPIAQFPCLLDLTRHQLNYSGNGSMRGIIYRPRTAEKVVVKVNPEVEYQEILGFGGILSPSAYWSLNRRGKEKWWDFIKEYNLLLQREYPTSARLKEDFSNWDDPDYLVPHYYGDNFPNGELTDFEYVKKIRSLGGMDIFEFWRLPQFLYEDEKLNTQKYAEAMVNYCKTSVEKTGKSPEIVGIQNEVTQSPETWRDMTLSLRAKLDENGFQDVKIHSFNAGRLENGISAMKGFQKYPGVWEKIDFAASNMYDYQAYVFSPDDFDTTLLEFKSIIGDKPFLSTEICVNASYLQTDVYKLAFSYAMLYHKNMTILDAIGIMYCWTLLDYTQPSFAVTRSLFTLDHSNDMQPVASGFQLRTFGAFSRHILKGMHRVEVPESSPLLVTAYSGEHQNTMVILNPTTIPVEINIQWDNFRFKGMERTSPYLGNQYSEIPGSLVIEPGEIITLYGNK